jgi:hypothetical protein
MLALEKGFHVVIEKPMTFTLDEAKQLKKKVEETGLLLCLTHTYSGYPMVRQARAMVREGALGKIRKVIVEYPQGWLSKMVSARQRTRHGEQTLNAAEGWRNGRYRNMQHLAEFITGSKISHPVLILTLWCKVECWMMMAMYY